MAIELLDSPPPHWNELIDCPFQTEQFASASTALGYQPYFVRRNDEAALVQFRTLGPFGLRMSRAYIYPARAKRDFMRDLLAELKKRGVCFARIGDTMSGPADPSALELPGVETVDRHTFVLDLEQDEDVIFGNMHRSARNRIRKTEKEGVETAEATSLDDVDEYWRLSTVTSDRIRTRGSIMQMPRAFFVEVFERMIKTGMARLILARHGDTLLSGVLCLVLGDTMLAYHAASTRDRSLTSKHGPTAGFWRAVRTARELGLKYFDFGGCTPGLPKTDSRYGVYFFKSQWGGELRKFYNGTTVLSPAGYRFQEKVLAPLWEVAHPLYLRLRR